MVEWTVWFLQWAPKTLENSSPHITVSKHVKANTKLLRKPINGLYCLGSNFFLNLSSRKYWYEKYRYRYRFSEFTSINSINGRYDKYHLVKLDKNQKIFTNNNEHDIEGFNTSKVSYRGNGSINCPFLVDKFIDFNLLRYYRRNLAKTGF